MHRHQAIISRPCLDLAVLLAAAEACVRTMPALLGSHLRHSSHICSNHQQASGSGLHDGHAKGLRERGIQENLTLDARQPQILLRLTGYPA